MKENAIGHLVKTNPIQTQTKLVLSAVEWANLKRAKMNINSIITNDYRKKDDFEVRINKPNLVRRRRIAKMNVNLYILKDYENKTAIRPQQNKPKQTHFYKVRGLKLKNSRSFIGLKNFENAVYLHSSAHFLKFSREL